jgi:CheY-like chemotaxis protein
MSTDSATVLVAGGDDSRRDAVARWLTDAGLTAVEANTGSAAVARLAAAPPIDAVFLDVQLPDTTGYAVCEKIKSDRQNAGVPVIHIAAADAVDRARGMSAGADGYLVEPIDSEELIATLKAVLRAHRSRREAELLAWRLSRLAELTVAMNAAPTLPGVLAAAAAGAARMWDAPVIVCAESAEGLRLAGVVAGDGTPPAIQEWAPAGPEAPVGVSQRNASPDDWALAEWPAGEDLIVVAARLRPDRAPVYVAAPASRPTPGAPVMNQLAQAIAGAVESQRFYDEEHRIARTLQRSLLQQRLPMVNGLDLAVRYSPASARTEVGGDFYELTALDRGLLIAVGDVAGHSLHAATVMAELRHAVRAYALDGHDPGEVVGRVNRLMRRLLPDEAATLCLILLDPATGRARMAVAGHPPPLLADAGSARFVDVKGPLLGVDVVRPADVEFVIPRGATLVLYTDGLIERRDREIDAGLRELVRCATTVDPDLERFCDRLLLELGGAGSEDDIAIVAVRRR